jgi:hypothetical protein
MPPKRGPIPKNTATREYFSPNKATDLASSSDNIDWPSSSSSSTSPPKPASSPSTKADAGASAQSPTPSDIVLAAHLDDVVVLGEENRKMMEKGVDVGERKRVLIGMREEREWERGVVEKGKGKEVEGDVEEKVNE